MLNDGSGTSSRGDYAAHITSDEIRDIHALISPPPPPPLPAGRGRRREAWETSSQPSGNLSVSSEGSSEQFTTLSGEFNALVLAGSTIQNDIGRPGENTSLARIGEDQEETNPLAIVPDSAPFDPVASPRRGAVGSSLSSSLMNTAGEEVLSVEKVKKEEVESKISAWQTAKIAKINNRFKREEAVINGWESEELQRATTWFKKEERKLEEKRARAMEKMQNEVAKARRKAEEKRASAEGKRGTKAARVLDLASLMRAMGRAPIKRSFF